MPGWSEHWPTASVCARCACRDQAIHQSRWGDFSIVAFRVSGPARLAVRVVFVQMIHQCLGVVVDGEIESEGDSRERKRQHALALAGAVFDDAQERGGAMLSEQREKRCGAFRFREHALVLDESPTTVDAIPVEHLVERIEELLGVDHAFGISPEVVRQRVERAHGPTVENPIGKLERYRNLSGGRRQVRWRFVLFSPSASVEDAVPAAKTVEPPDRERPIGRGVLEGGDEGVDVAASKPFFVDPG